MDGLGIRGVEGYRRGLPSKSLLLKYRDRNTCESKSGAVERSSLIQSSRRNCKVHVCNAGDHSGKLLIVLLKLLKKVLTDEARY
jgi:hypothetical protein